MTILSALSLAFILSFCNCASSFNNAAADEAQESPSGGFLSSNADVYFNAEALVLNDKAYSEAEELIRFALSELKLNSYEKSTFERLLVYLLIETDSKKEAADILERLALESPKASAKDFQNVCQLRIALEEFEAASHVCQVWHDMAEQLTADQLWKLSIVEKRGGDLEAALFYLESVISLDEKKGTVRDDAFEFLLYLYIELDYSDEIILALRDRWESHRNSTHLSILVAQYQNYVGGVDSLEWVEAQLTDPRNSVDDRMKLSQLMLMQDYYKLTSKYHLLLKKLKAEFGPDFPAPPPIYGMTPAPKAK